MANPLIRLVRDQDIRTTRHTTKPLDLIKQNARLDIMKNFFTIRCVDAWNSLPAHVQSTDDLDDFKKGYDEFVAS